MQVNRLLRIFVLRSLKGTKAAAAMLLTSWDAPVWPSWGDPAPSVFPNPPRGCHRSAHLVSITGQSWTIRIPRIQASVPSWHFIVYTFFTDFYTVTPHALQLRQAGWGSSLRIGSQSGLSVRLTGETIKYRSLSNPHTLGHPLF